MIEKITAVGLHESYRKTLETLAERKKRSITSQLEMVLLDSNEWQDFQKELKEVIDMGTISKSEGA